MIPLRSNLTHNRKIIRNCKKIQKIQKNSYGFFSSKNWLEKAKKKRKYKLTFRFVPTQRVIENSKQIVKKFKKLQNTIMVSFQAKIRGETLRTGENKNYLHVPCQPNA